MNFWTKLKVENLELINTEQEEFSPHIWGDYLIYVGLQNNEGLLKNSKSYFFDLKASLLKPESDLPQFIFTNELNSQFHEGPVSWDQENNKIYYTRANSIEGEAVVDEQGRQQLNIFRADYAQGKWGNISKLDLKLENETYCHPAIFDSGHKIIFASPLADGNGKMDLYLSIKNGDEWESPINLGDKINQDGNQWFPFVHNDQHLFYASDLGDGQGLDLYYATLDENASVIKTQRLPFPINTSYDDFGLIFSEDGQSAYFSSNRIEGRGKDDIYVIIFEEQ